MTKDLTMLPTGSLEALTSAAYRIPVLSADEERTLQDLAEQFGVSAERIRQIEKSAMRKLRVQLEW